MKKATTATLENYRNITFLSSFKRAFIKYTPLVSSYLLAALFLYAAYNKLIIYKRFVTQLNNSPLLTDLHNHVLVATGLIGVVLAAFLFFKEYRKKALWAISSLLVLFMVYKYIFPNALSNPYLPAFLSWFVPSLEIITAVLLILNKTRIIGLYAAFITMLAFTIYVYTLPHFYNGGCSCGGIISNFTWRQHYWFNIVFTALAMLGLCLQPSPKPTTKTETD